MKEQLAYAAWEKAVLDDCHNIITAANEIKTVLETSFIPTPEQLDQLETGNVILRDQALKLTIDIYFVIKKLREYHAIKP